MKKTILPLAFLLMAASVAGENTTVATVINEVLCNIIFVLYTIAPGIGVVVITLEGIRWIGSADDPGARKKAKEGIIHAIVGLIIVMTAIPLITMIMAGTEQFYACITYYTGYSSGGDGSGGSNYVGYTGDSGGSNYVGYTGDSGGSNYVGYGGMALIPGAYYVTDLVFIQGWNLFSIPLILNETNVSVIFKGVDYDVLYGWNSDTKSWNYSLPEYGGNLTDIELDKGYWIHVNKNTTLIVSGWAPLYYRNISLIQGWNLIGYSGYTPQPLVNVMEDIDYAYVYSWNATQALQSSYGSGWKVNSPFGSSIAQIPPKPPLMKDYGYAGMTSLSYMDQARGYWVYVYKNVSLVYPTNYPV